MALCFLNREIVWNEPVELTKRTARPINAVLDQERTSSECWSHAAFFGGLWWLESAVFVLPRLRVKFARSQKIP